MQRRELLRTVVLGGTAGLAGCTGGGDGGDGAGDMTPDTTATPTTTETDTPAALQTATAAADGALSSYRRLLEAFQTVGVDGNYHPRNGAITDALSELETALSDAGAAYQGEKVTLNNLAAYLGAADRALKRAEPGVTTVASVVADLTTSPAAALGRDGAGTALGEAKTALGNVQLQFRELQSDLDGIAANEMVLTEDELDTTRAKHGAAREQIAALQMLRDGLTRHVRGVQAYQAARSHVTDAELDAEAGNGEQARAGYETAREEFRTAAKRVRSARATLAEAQPGVSDAMAVRLSLVGCRADAVAGASEGWAQAVTATIEGNHDRDRRKRADAEETRRRCDASESS